MYLTNYILLKKEKGINGNKEGNKIQIEKRQGLIKYQDFLEKVYRYSLLGMNIGGGSDTSNSGEEYVVKCLT